jgi:hypothetical protein
MSARVSAIAPIGSLLKGAPRLKATARKHRPRREHDGKHLAAVRRCPCLSCDNDPAGEAAHLRISGPGKLIAGMSNKPDDRWALPLCRACHTGAPSAQHRVGEVAFWAELHLDPLAIAERLYRVSPDVPAMRDVIFAEREKRK